MARSLTSVDWRSDRPYSSVRRPGKRNVGDQAKNRPPTLGRPGLAKSSGEEGKTLYNDGFALAVGVAVVLGACAGVAVSAPEFVISRISTRLFLARPSRVLLDSTGLSFPSPIR